MSSNSQTPVNIELYNRDGVDYDRDPLFGADSTYDISRDTKQGQLLYKEDSNTYAMNSFQDHGGIGVFILEAGACAATTPVKTFAGTWPATEQRICFFDK